MTTIFPTVGGLPHSREKEAYMELFKASNQWAQRPSDERFSSLEDLYNRCSEYRIQAKEKTVDFGDLRVNADRGEVVITGKQNLPARMTHWAFGQLCTKLGAPGSYMRELPATLAAQNINYGLAKGLYKENGDEKQASLLLHRDMDDVMLSAITSPKYSRIWNSQVVTEIQALTDFGWRVPPARPAFGKAVGARPATAADVLNDSGFGLSVNVGDMIAPAGLYASDHDLFIFMVNEKFRINDGSADGLSRGFFVENSEVGAASLKVLSFLYKHVCGNHIVWDATGVQELRIPHIGDANERYRGEIVSELQRYAESSAKETEQAIRNSQSFELERDQAMVVDFLFGKKILTKKRATEAFEDAQTHPEDGSPRSAWGMAQAITRLSQQCPFADERVKMDRAAAKVLSIAQ